MSVSRSEEPFDDAALIEHLERSRMQSAGSRPIEMPIDPSFDDDDFDPCQRQLAGQHQSCRPGPRNHHCVLGHPTPQAR